ncbi:hypothetical protein QAD02_018420 [Eretmocerus hayati]|uniref:Uncharacterized protein n=1 Tax=Eretmocerus hayati TaxID=131215 RepID=A0ACC2PGM9_9HYME|nr:hypothetical protein QAD02_018420 [Eretmocerus hayati]
MQEEPVTQSRKRESQNSYAETLSPKRLCDHAVISESVTHRNLIQPITDFTRTIDKNSSDEESTASFRFPANNLSQSSSSYPSGSLHYTPSQTLLSNRSPQSDVSSNTALPNANDEAQTVKLAEERRFDDAYDKAVNFFCEFPCDICTKLCYRSQTASINEPSKSHLPESILSKPTILVCKRCNTHLKSNKTTAPSKAFWNNLDPGPQPEVLKSLTNLEQRLLARIIPFVTVVKLQGRFGQYGFKGQAILFAQDIQEVTERLPAMLPRSPSTAGVIVVTEQLQNLDIV